MMSDSSEQPPTGDYEGDGQPDLLCTWQIPALVAGQAVALQAMPGHITAVVGPNGSGKSALGHWLQQQAAGAKVRRVIAHRRLWFESAGPDITSPQREQLGVNITHWGADPQSRWRDHAQAQRASVVLFDLLAQINDYNARVVELLKQGVQPEHIWDAVGISMLDRINSILGNAHLKVRLATTDRATFEAVTVDGCPGYPIQEMSDGEKSALLLSAEVMTVPSSSLVIIDEPERHLHRLISASLIEAIAAGRQDCHFVVLTHDLDLAASLPRSSTTLAVLAKTTWSNGLPVGWDLRILDPEDDIPESARCAILGGRRRVPFLEGEAHSLDLRLYEVLFDEWTLMPVGGCDQVIRAVHGLLTSETHHWVHGRGIVDGDGRDAAERANLAVNGILALAVSEVESLYYSEIVRRALAARQGETLGKEPTELLDDSTHRALAALSAGDTPNRLAASVAEKIVSRRLFDDLPTRAELATGVDPVVVSTSSPFPMQLAQLAGYLQAADLESIVREYPIRDTSLRADVAASLGFKSIEHYEAAALARIRHDPQLATAVRQIIGDLP
ncbi:MAG TPA: AAA family ATPase [Acidimicrobiales bacterium]|nr:AAA family ATPase [Acidimicrobiales bacterium]